MSFDPVHKVIPAFVVGEINPENADRLIAQTQAVNDGSLHVFFSDQRPQYREAILKAFGQWMPPERQGQRGRRPQPRWVPPPDLLYAQVVKHRRKGRVVKVTTEVVFGTPEALGAYRKRSPASRRVNTAFVERQNNTMRQRNRRFTRKTLGFSKKRYWMERQLHLCVGDYHFCLPHSGLREEIDPPLPTKGNGSPKKWREVTPRMAAGVTDHVWTLQELLMYRVPPRAPENIVSIDEGHQTISCIWPNGRRCYAFPADPKAGPGIRNRAGAGDGCALRSRRPALQPHGPPCAASVRSGERGRSGGVAGMRGRGRRRCAWPRRIRVRGCTCLASEGYEVSHTGGGNRGGSRAGAVRTDIR
jgi:hypothetical protein